MPDASRTTVESRLMELYPDREALLALVTEQGLSMRTLPSANGAPLVEAILEAAEAQGRFKGLLRACLRQHPEDPVLRDALRRDPRFAGEPATLSNDPLLAAASSMRAALTGWQPSHVWALDEAGLTVATLIAGGLGQVQRVPPPRDPTEALDTLKTLAATPEPRHRVLLVVGEARNMELGRALVERAQSLNVLLSLYSAEAV